MSNTKYKKITESDNWDLDEFPMVNGYDDEVGLFVNVVTGKCATEGLLKGIHVATNAIRLSYGAGGCNSIIENELPPYHTVVNDADTIIQSINIDDNLSSQGLSLLKELSAKANKDSGDGRKTTCIIAEVLLDEGFNLHGGNKIKYDLDEFITLIENKIDEKRYNGSKVTEKEIETVATIASESKEIGKTVGEIYKKIGKEGIIHVESSEVYKTSVEYIDGVRFEQTGYLSPYMADKTSGEGRYKNPTILVTKKRINNIDDINPLLYMMSENNKDTLVIFTDDMDSEVASLLINLHKSGKMKVLIIKAPVLWKNYVFEDFAKCVGATIVEDSTGITFKNLSLDNLGTCGEIVSTKDETIVLRPQDISEHIAYLSKEHTEDNSLRLSWLVTKTAILKMGANSESELSYKMLKAKDAINSCRLALKGGVVKGGGIVLSEIADEMSTVKENSVQSIIQKALRAPLIQNMENMGIEKPNWGNEVLDSAIVVKNAVRNAIGLASTVLTTSIVIFNDEEKEEIKNTKLF